MPVNDPALRRFGDNVRALREAKDVSQEQLAEESGLDRTYISGVERGVRNPSLLSVVSLARGLGVSVSKLCQEVEQ